MNSKMKRNNVLLVEKLVNSFLTPIKFWSINSIIILFIGLQLLNQVPAFAESVSNSNALSNNQFVSVNGETSSEFLFLYQIDDRYYLYDPGLDTSIEIGVKTGWDRTLLSPRCSNCIEYPQSHPSILIEDGYKLLRGILSEDKNKLVYVENSYDSRSETFLSEFQMWLVDLESGDRLLIADNSNSSIPEKLLYPVMFDAEKELIYFESYDHIRMKPFSGIYIYKIKEKKFTEIASESDYYNSALWVSPDNLYLAATGVSKGSVGDTPIQFSKSTTLLLLDFTQEILQSIYSDENLQILPQGWISKANSTILRSSSGIQASSVLAVQEASSGFQRPMSNDHYGFVWLQWTAGYTPLVYHPGDDYNGPGNDCGTDISAVGNGVVKNLNLGGWGTLVIEHYWQGITVYSQYGHLASSLVSIGDNVTKGQHIAEMGATGAASCHLHWEIRQSDHPDPNNSGYYTTNVLNVKSNVENYYYDPEWWVDNHGSYNNCNNPSPSSDQVGIYADANYCGSYKIFNLGEWSSPGAMGFGNDSVSSVKVGGNVKAVLCKDDNYSGGCEEFTGDDSNLSDNSTGDNSVSSMKVQSRGSSSGSWTANYYDTVDRWWDNNNSGNFKCSENVGGPTLDKNYGTSGPCGMDGDNWVADYSATINFASGNYVFLSDHDDGLKIWLNGQNIGDYGGSGSNDKACPARNISGNANLRVMLREDGGDARAKVWWTTDTSVCVQRPSPPSLNSPANNATVGRYDSVVLSWNSVSGASQYYTEFSGGPGFSVNSGWTSGTSFTVGSTFWGGVYTWRVMANNSAGNSDWSETRTLYRKYGSPSNLTLSGVTQTQVNLSWSASADAPGNIDGYRIYRNGSAIATVSSATTSYTNTGLSCGGSYSYYVKAYKGSLESDPSETRSITTSSCTVCYTLTRQANPSGGGSVSANPAPNCNGTQYTAGTSVQLTANANSGYSFSSWSGDASGSSNPTTVTMNGNKTVTANFTAAPAITLWIGGYGAAAGGWQVDRHPRMLGDVNGDGKDDVVGFGESTVFVSLSTGSYFGAAFPAYYGFTIASGGWQVPYHPRAVADVNGDGKDDLVGFGNMGVYVALSTSSGSQVSFGPAQVWVGDYGLYAGGWQVSQHPRLLGDVNGDGRADIVGFGNAGVYVSLSTGSNFTPKQFWLGAYGLMAGNWQVDRHPRILADVNGDGKQDILGFADMGVYVSYSTGTGFTSPALVSNQFSYVAGGWQVGLHPRTYQKMVPGCGAIIGFGNAGVYRATSTCSGFNTMSLVVPAYGLSAGNWQVGLHPRITGDVNGDGVDDIIGFGSSGVFVTILGR